MRAYQRLNEIIENHKGLIIGIGLTALIANYEPANAAEKKKDPPKPNITVDLGGGLSINPYTRQAGFSDGNISYGPGFASPNIGNSTDDLQKKSQPTYKYNTVQEYMDRIKEAYENNEYQTMVDLSQDALNRKIEINASNLQVEKLKYFNVGGKELVAKKVR